MQQITFQNSCERKYRMPLCLLRIHPSLFAAYTTPLSPTVIFPLTGETYSQNFRNDSTSNKLSLSIASDVGTTSSKSTHNRKHKRLEKCSNHALSEPFALIQLSKTGHHSPPSSRTKKAAVLALRLSTTATFYQLFCC